MEHGERTPVERSSGAEPATRDPQARGRLPFAVVGIGASAGGLDALKPLISALRLDTGMAFVVVQHLDPRRESLLTELLQKSTDMPVIEATDDLAVERDHVYINPPNAVLTLREGRLRLAPRSEARGQYLPIDAFFRSLASEQQERAIGIVLSGAGTDGTLGLCEIKSVGGIAFAQNEGTAQQVGMPRSAISSGCVDFALAPAAIAKRLIEIGSHPYLGIQALGRPVDADEDEQYQEILTLVRSVLGVDFSQYRDTTIRRRILRRMALHAEESLPEYIERLKGDRGEVEALYHDLLINVTSFFRDPEVFESLKKLVFPQIVDGRAAQVPLRVWVPGCSTGQESYSIAMALVEFFDEQTSRPPIHIFATDLSDERALAKARHGFYPEGIEAELSPERLQRFFHREDDVYRIDKSIREMCVFARHNVTADPPFSRLDLVSCRNVLIYLSPPLQKRVLPIFHYALNIPGFLLLGSAETIGDHTDLFEAVDRENRLYAKKPGPMRPMLQLAADDLRNFSPLGPRRPVMRTPATADFHKEADRVLLGRFAPPGVVVGANFQVLQFRGHVGPYLEPAPGEPTANVLKLAREGLFLELRSALAEATARKETVRRQPVRVRADGAVREVSLEIVPLKTPLSAEICFLILFHEPGPDVDRWDDATAEGVPIEARELAQLRQELASTKEYMQSLVEQQDVVNEELRSANEEILSSNEELQSTNEELETAKEELQSVNEELTTVNEQLQQRNTELSVANNDLGNLMSSTSLPMLMVGGDLRIRRFTTAAKKVLRLVATDIGRSIDDIRPSARLPELGTLINSVIASTQPAEADIQDADGKWHSLRVHPYRSSPNTIEGAVLFLVDIDQLKRAQVSLSESQERLNTALRVGRMGVWSLDLEAGRMTLDPMLAELLGIASDTGTCALDEFWTHLHPLDVERVRTSFDTAIAGDTQPFEFRVVLPDGMLRWLCSACSVRRDVADAATQVVGVSYEITQLKQAEISLLELNRRKDEFLALLSHELRHPLAPIRNAVEIMRLAGQDPSAIASARAMLDRQVTQLARIVDDLIDVSRIIGRKIRLKPQRFDLRRVIDTALETCRSGIEGNDQRLELDLPDELIQIDGDPMRITQVLVNVLNNATKFTGASGRITLAVRRIGADARANRPESVEITVADTGIGIPPELLPRIFDLFFQGDSSIERVRGGLGIGLSLVQSLVSMHGGTIEAHSDGIGCGSRFVITLPLASGDPPAPGESDLLPITKQRRRSRRKVLIVDDNEDQVESLGKLVEMLGHDVRTARDGEKAIEVAQRFEPEIALIDIGLPLINGYEVARRLRADARFNDVLLVAQTGWGGIEDRHRSEEAGFDHHLVKPVEFDELKRILASKKKPSA